MGVLREKQAAGYHMEWGITGREKGHNWKRKKDSSSAYILSGSKSATIPYTVCELLT